MTNKAREQAVEKIVELLWEEFENQTLCFGGDEKAKSAANRIVTMFESLGYVLKGPDQSLPEIPSFAYDKEEDRPLLHRGAINYSKMLAGWVKVKKGQPGRAEKNLIEGIGEGMNELLTPEEICVAFCGEGYCMQEDKFPCSRFNSYKAIAQAQHYKDTHPPKLDQPYKTEHEELVKDISKVIYWYCMTAGDKDLRHTIYGLFYPLIKQIEQENEKKGGTR